MDNFKELHREFIEKAQRPMDLGRLPIDPSAAQVPIFASDRWHLVDGALKKTYRFRRPDDRQRFVVGLLEYERQVDHHSLMIIDSESVTLTVKTHDLDKVTELDKEYAAFCDVCYRDIVYSPSDGSQA